MSVNEKMTSIASGLRTLSATTDKMGLDSMSEHIAQANETVNGQTVLIREIKKALVNKSANSGDVADYNQGYDDGFAAGKTEGSNEGYNQGKTDGYQEGRDSIKLYNETITESGTYTVEPTDGFDGFSSVLVDVADRYDEGKADGITEGVASVKIQPEKTTDTNGTVEPDSPYVALKKVVVAVPERYNEGFEDGKTAGIAEGKASIKLYDETITESGSYTVEPKEGFDGFSLVTVDVPERYDEGFEDGKASVKIQPEKETKENGTVEPDEGFDGLAKVIVAVPQKIEVDLEETITENHKTFTYEPEDGETFKKVIINVNVPTEIEGEFNGVALLESGKCGESINYNIYDNGWVVLEGTGDTYDCDGYWLQEDEPANVESPFCNNTLITHIYVSDGITRVGNELFAGCIGVEEVRLPDGLIRIGMDAFYGTSIFKLYIPNSLRFIETDAFCDCLNLTDVYYNGTKSDWDDMWGESGLWVDMAIHDAGLANTTLHCEYEEPATETWEFEMEDGSIVTKEVVVV